MSPFARTQLGNADRLVAQQSGRLRWCPAWSSWLVWDGARWVRDHGGRARALAIETVRSIRRDDEEPTDKDKRQSYWRFIGGSETAAAISGMLTLAQPALSVEVEQLDAQPHLLNTPTCTIDLRTGTARPNDPKDLLTLMTRAPFETDATCPRWAAFLRDATDGDEDLIAYLQRVAGYAATGLSSERALVILHGASATGKSTFLETLRSALGDYAWVTPVSTLLGARTGGIPTDIAALARRRLVIASEADDRTPWDGATVKRLTGGDTLTARRLYGEYHEFQPSHTLILATNEIPSL